MPAIGNAIRAQAPPLPEFVSGDPAPAAPAEGTRAALYAGLVGDGAPAGALEQRLLAAAGQSTSLAEPADMAHQLSVVTGYVALAAGCAATVTGLAMLF